jgi:Mg-chelatase subunit ChlD
MKRNNNVFSILLVTLLSHIFFLGILFTNPLVADAQEQAVPSDVILVLDNSGSMKKNDPDFLAKDVVTRSLIDLGSRSRLGMVFFDSQAKLTVNLMETESARARANILNSLNSLDYKGLFSDTAAGIERAIYELKLNGREDAQKIIVLLTDGIVDTGDKELDIEKTNWLKEALAQECSRAGIKIIGVAFTEMADFSLIQTLAIKTDGEYFRAYKAEDIQNIFSQIREILSRPEAQSIPSTSPVEEREEEKPDTEGRAETESPVVQMMETPAPEIESESTAAEERKPFQKEGITWPLVFTGIVLLGIILIGLILIVRRPGRRVKSPRDIKDSEPDIPKAILVLKKSYEFCLAKQNSYNV